MSHEVESMFYVGEVPWHGLGKPITEGKQYSIAEGIVDSGLDWEVGLLPLSVAEGNMLYWRDGKIVEGDPVPEELVGAKAKRFNTVRLSDNSILGNVGPIWRPLQNRVAFDFFQPFLEAGEAELHTAGSLFGGAKVWVLAKLNRDPIVVGKDDNIVKFILLSNSHDGTTSIRVGFTPIRTVCANTLAMAHNNEFSQLIRIRHTGQTEGTLEKVRELMDTANARFEATAEQYKVLANSNVASQKDLVKYIKVVLGAKENAKGELPTRTLNIIASIVENFDGGGDGGELMPDGSTWWRAYNAINTRLNHTIGRSRETRMGSLWFGANANTNEKALATAVKFATNA